MRPSSRRRAISRAARLAAVAVVVALLAAGCGSAPSTDPAPVVDASGVLADEELAAVGQVLQRYAARDADTTPRAPDLLGLEPSAAQARLADLGFEMALVAFDPAAPVTAQDPAPGEPVRPGRPVEVWLGTPPSPTPPADPTAAPDGTDDAAASPPPADPPAASPTDVVEATPTAAPTEVAAADPGPETRYVLPPHQGPLRVNPRQLPALPVGTVLSGMASWYGPGFHGLTTACGQVYDQNGPTIAARELRCGTVVRITGPTGLTVQATVTDWGPAEWTGRRFDLSAAVFNAIAPLSAGVVPVTVHVAASG